MKRNSHRHGSTTAPPAADGCTSALRKRVLILGNPNVGKSVLFHRLTGRYVTVSNYPGTTVEVTRGDMRVGDTSYEVIDTPGMYSLHPITEEERVARAMLLTEHTDLAVHVADARNLDRMLPFTLQLIEAGLPVLLVPNMADEAARSGVVIDSALLAARLGIPVVPTSALHGRGIDQLREAIHDHA